MVELPEAQLLLVALLYLDLAAQAVLSAPGWADGPPAPGRGGGSGGPSPPSLLEGWTPVSDALEGLRDFAAACFFLELLLLLLAYGPRRFLSHPGCVMDATAVGAAAAAGPLAAGAAMAALPGLLRPLLRPPPQALVRLLPFLRAWRVVRLCGRSSADGDGGPEEMRRRLEDARAEAAALRARSAALEAGRRREASRRRRAEGQARRTRKEADELGEALLIAAVEAEKMSGDGDGSGRKAEKDADEDKGTRISPGYPSEKYTSAWKPVPSPHTLVRVGKPPTKRKKPNEETREAHEKKRRAHLLMPVGNLPVKSWRLYAACSDSL